VDDSSKLSERLRECGVRFVSKRDESRSQIVRDPDGHALTLQAASSSVSAAASRQAMKQ
jgi:hypothetical protein